MLLNIKLDMYVITTQIRSYFDNIILKRGWSYYLDKEVLEVKVEGASILKARVWGSSTYRVKIDLAAFSTSTCNCPYGGYCKHLAAVLFEVCDLAGEDPKLLLNPAKSAYKAPAAALSGRTPLISAASAEASKRQRQTPVTKPKENGTTAQWHQYFAKQFDHSRAYNVYTLDTFYSDVMRRLSPLSVKWQPLMGQMYQLHLHLFIMKQADAIYHYCLNSFYYYYDYSGYFKKISEQCLRQLRELMKVIDSREIQRQYPLQLAETIDFLTANAFPDPKKAMMDWTSAYRLLWQDLLNQEHDMLNEQTRLQAILANKETASNQDAYILAAAHFDIMAHRDDKAMAMLKMELQNPNPGSLMEYLQAFTELQDWDRLLHWLQWLESQMKLYGQGCMRDYYYFWNEVCKNRDSEREYVQTAVSLLPESFTYYAQRLLEQGSYQQWVDLCLAMDVSPLEINSSELKLIEIEQIGLLRPLYHHAVERRIQERNRDSYKIAVRLLKKLRTVYKKIKNQDRFAQYVNQLSKQYSRLRAFQEELRKGKLIE